MLSSNYIENIDPQLTYIVAWEIFPFFNTAKIKVIKGKDKIPTIGVMASVAGSGIWLTPGSGTRDGKKSGSGIRDEHPESDFLELRTIILVKNTWFLWSDPDPGFYGPGIRVTRMEKFGSGIQNKHPGSTTLAILDSALKLMLVRNTFFLFLPFCPIVFFHYVLLMFLGKSR